MPNNYFEFDPSFIPGTKARAGDVNTQFAAVEAAFDLLPTTPSALTRGVAELGTESGSGNSFVVTMPNTRLTNQNGDIVLFKATHANTGAITLNVDGIGAVSARGVDDVEFSGGEIVVGRFYAFRYNSTTSRFHLTENSDGSNKVTYAAEWANKAFNSLVSTAAGGDGVDDYSALHWATVAAAAAAGVGVQNVAFRGNHDASGNTAPLTPSDRSIYRISVAGTFATLSWVAGDYALYNGTTWERVSTVSATNLSAGTLPDARLSANVPLLNAANAFTANQFIVHDTSPRLEVFDSTNGVSTVVLSGDLQGLIGTLSAHGLFIYAGNSSRAFFAGDGSELEVNVTLFDLNANADISGTLAWGGGGAISSSSNVPLLNAANVFTGASMTLSNAGGPSFAVTDTTNNLTTAVQSGDTTGFVGTTSAHTLALMAGGVTRAFFAGDGSEFQVDATLLDFNGAADFSNTVTIASTLLISNATQPVVDIYEQDATADNRRWRYTAAGDSLFLQTVNDADSVAATWGRVDRTGTTVDVVAFAADEIDLTATTLDLNGTLDVDGGAHAIDGTSITLTSSVGNVTLNGASNVRLEAGGGAGTVQLVGSVIQISGTPDFSVADGLGGGAAATLGTIGGGGPSAAGQSAWLRITYGAASRWIPMWA